MLRGLVGWKGLSGVAGNDDVDKPVKGVGARGERAGSMGWIDLRFSSPLSGMLLPAAKSHDAMRSMKQNYHGRVRPASFSRPTCRSAANLNFLVAMLHNVGTRGPVPTHQAYPAGVPKLQVCSSRGYC